MVIKNWAKKPHSLAFNLLITPCRMNNCIHLVHNFLPEPLGGVAVLVFLWRDGKVMRFWLLCPVAAQGAEY